MDTTFFRQQILERLHSGTGKIIASLSAGELSGNAVDSSFHEHLHPGRELLFVVSGVSLFTLDGRIYDAVPGTFFLIDQWEKHSFYYRRCDKELLHLWFYSNNEDLSCRLLRIQQGGQVEGTLMTMVFERLLGQLLNRRWDLLKKKAPCVEETCSQFLRLSLNLLLEEISLYISGHLPESNENREGIVPFLKTYIRNVNGRDCSLERLEKLSGYSRFYLARSFKQQTSSTIGQYINDIRKHFAQEAKRRGHTQKEIAQELGFSSPAAYWLWQKKNLSC